MLFKVYCEEHALRQQKGDFTEICKLLPSKKYFLSLDPSHAEKYWVSKTRIRISSYL